jgi:hypothetical protein
MIRVIITYNILVKIKYILKLIDTYLILIRNIIISKNFKLEVI